MGATRRRQREQDIVLADRLGNHVLLPRGRTVLRDWLAGEERYAHVGVHDGLSAAGMRVPLVVAPAL